MVEGLYSSILNRTTIGYAYGTGLLYKKKLIKAKRGRKTRGYAYVSVFV